MRRQRSLRTAVVPPILFRYLSLKRRCSVHLLFLAWCVNVRWFVRALLSTLCFCFALAIQKGSAQLVCYWSEAPYSLHFLHLVCFWCFLCFSEFLSCCCCCGLMVWFLLLGSDDVIFVPGVSWCEASTPTWCDGPAVQRNLIAYSVHWDSLRVGPLCPHIYRPTETVFGGIRI